MRDPKDVLHGILEAGVVHAQSPEPRQTMTTCSSYICCTRFSALDGSAGAAGSDGASAIEDSDIGPYDV